MDLNPLEPRLVGHIFTRWANWKGGVKSFWSQWKQDAGWRVMLERWAERGHPINPQQAASYPLYKVIFLVPALCRVRAPSKFPTIDRTTPDHCYDQSALVPLRKAQYEFHVSIKYSSRARVTNERGIFDAEGVRWNLVTEIRESIWIPGMGKFYERVITHELYCNKNTIIIRFKVNKS